MDKICFICDTPFQLLNGFILWRYMCQERSNVVADLYMGNMYNSCQNISDILKQTHMFNDVFFYNLWNTKTQSLTKGSVLEKIGDLFFPEIMMKRLLQRDIPKNEYKEIYFGYYGRLLYFMLLFNQNAQLNGFEEGIGTYLLEQKDYKFYTMKRLSRSLIGKPYPSLMPVHIYFYYPDLFSSLQKDTLIIPRQMPMAHSEDATLKVLLPELFDFQRNPLYDQRRIVYLTQPYYEVATAKGPEAEMPILNACKTFHNDIVLKVHYRQQVNDEYRAFEGDWRGEFWELVSLFQITDDHILLSAFSTAQLTPKLMFDKEPWVIFTSPLWQKDVKEPTPKEAGMINALRQIYRKPEKIIVIREISELSAHLERILSEGTKNHDKKPE